MPQVHIPVTDRRNIPIGTEMQRERAFKEKYVSVCEEIFSGRSPIQTALDRGIQGRTALNKFWDEFLLLKVNQEFLAQTISSRTEDELRHGLKPIVNEMFSACVTYLADENFIRVAHALETLAILSREIFRKRFSQQGVTVTLLLAGSAANADSFFRRLISNAGALLVRDNVPVLVKSLATRLCLTMLTATDNVNSNPITSYFCSNSIFDPLVSVLSLRLTADRKRLEVDAVLLLLVLLLWRESENTYISRLASPLAPLQPLLNTIVSLLSSSSAAANTGDPSNSSGWEWENMIGYLSSWLGGLVTGAEKGTDCRLQVNKCCGLMLLYFVVYHNPAFKANQIWPSDQGTGGLQSVSPLWISVLQTFTSLCQNDFFVAPASSVERSLQAKVSLTILRCIFETPYGASYLWHCDTELSLMQSAGTVVPFKSLACVLVENAGSILTEPSVDPDLMYRAAVLIPLALKTVKSQGWQLPSSSLNSGALWKALIGCLERCPLSAFQRPGVQEAVEILTGTLEWFLATSQDIFVAAEETESLHATVMCNAHVLDKFMEAASSMNKNMGQLVNVCAVKYHYEVQVAALRPTFQQALAGIKKKGYANLKLKPKHAGPGRIYIEGTSEMRLLNGLIRFVLNLHKTQMYVIPKLEYEAL